MTTTLFTTPEDAEDAFYEALGRADLDALMNVWADDEDIVCIHPTGQKMLGARAIRENWRRIFASNSRFTVHITHKLCWESALLSVHSVSEMLYLGNEKTPHGPMLSTNVFMRGAKGWRLLSHHTSSASEASEAAEPPFESSEADSRVLH